jgi:PAS domain S-box-containing protein
MKKIPEIIKILREEEKQGKLKSQQQSTYEELHEVSEETLEEPPEENNLFSKNGVEMSPEDIELATLEEKYQIIFENYAVAITLANDQERIVSWNNYAEELLEMNEQDLFMRPVETLYPTEEWKKIRKENVRQQGMKYKLETKIIKKDQNIIDVELSLCVLRGAEGRTVGSIGIIRDITKLKNAEKKLVESEEKYRTIFENSAVAITLTDENENIISWNKYAENLLNMGKNDLFMKPVESLYPPEEWEKIRQENVRQKGMQHHLETKMIKNNNELIDVAISLSVLKNHRGEIIGSIGVIKDITERKKIERKLAFERELLQSLLDNIPDSIYFKDEKSRFIKVNKAKAEHSNVTPDKMIGKTDYEFLHEKDAEAIHVDDNIVMETGQPIINKIEKLTGGDEKTRWISVTKVPRFDPEGNIIGTMGISRDITELKKIEEKLSKSEKKFRDIFDSTSDLLLYLDPDGTILDINNTAIKMSGLEKENVVGKPFSKIRRVFSPGAMKKHLEAITISARGEKAKDYETDLVSKDDITYRFLFSNDLIKENDETKGILVRGRDVTQRQRAWDELVKLEERYRVLAETSADGVITIDPLGRLTYVNPSFEKMCGRRKSQILATLFRDYLSEDSIYLFQQVFIDARKKNEKIENVELELMDVEDNMTPVEVNIAPLTKNDEFAGMVCTVRDITERKKVEEELKKSERLKTEFMNIAAHELKSPVTPIKGYLDLIIQDKDASDTVKNWAKISLRNSVRLMNLVNDILDVSRLDTDTMRFDMEKLDPVDILREVVEDIKPVVTAKKIEFIANIPRRLPGILGDKNRLSQVLKNILENAVKFTDNGSITIGAQTKNKALIIYVEDTGIGISNDELKKIFTKFYQAYTGDDRKNEGTGLGLFISKEIVQKHNGKIWAESELGKGSKFVIQLPIL